MIENNNEIQLSVFVNGKYKNLGDINNIDDKYECNTKYKNNNSPMFNHGFDCTLSINTDDILDNDKFNKLFGIDESKIPDSYYIEFSCCIPCKRHKKKRINKNG